MCSEYWNLNTEITCPHCGVTAELNLQTHWMGDYGSCVNNYRLGDPIAELNGIADAVMDSSDGGYDDFITTCDC